MNEILLQPLELSEDELDLVAGGGGSCGCGGVFQTGVFQNGLVNVNDVNILSGIGILGTGIAV